MLSALRQRNQESEQEQLLKLYWNRAGVKRELANLKREHYDLLEKLQQQEGDIVRAQSQLEGLERLLTNPLAAANAMVYFQLRHMWRVGAIKVEQFGRELQQQREKRERQQLHKTVLAKRNRRLSAIKEKLDELLQKRKRAIEECLRFEKRLERMNFFVKIFAGPSLKRRIQSMKSNRQALEERVEEFNEMIEKIQGEPLPEPDGLSVDSRRLINVAIISLAQHLVVHFSEHDLARLARKSMKRSVADMKFGDRRICDQMVERIRVRIEQLNADKTLADRVKQRADKLLNDVRYRHDSDTIPMARSVAEIPQRIEPNGSDMALHVNVIEDDYWDLNAILK
ncbi:MAG: hypothetical protein R3305_05120 [Gammaproteobacteria bacterium]|nr:hypothetical protein [Gammaproteobacteria bacterium]